MVVWFSRCPNEQAVFHEASESQLRVSGNLSFRTSSSVVDSRGPRASYPNFLRLTGPFGLLPSPGIGESEA